MKCVETTQVPKSPGPRLINFDGGVIGRCPGDPEDDDKFYHVRYSRGAHDVIKKFEREPA